MSAAFPPPPPPAPLSLPPPQIKRLMSMSDGSYAVVRLPGEEERYVLGYKVGPRVRQRNIVVDGKWHTKRPFKQAPVGMSNMCMI